MEKTNLSLGQTGAAVLGGGGNHLNCWKMNERKRREVKACTGTIHDPVVLTPHSLALMLEPQSYHFIGRL
jgi:hypothetical protein